MPAVGPAAVRSPRVPATRSSATVARTPATSAGRDGPRRLVRCPASREVERTSSSIGPIASARRRPVAPPIRRRPLQSNGLVSPGSSSTRTLRRLNRRFDRNGFFVYLVVCLFVQFGIAINWDGNRTEIIDVLYIVCVIGFVQPYFVNLICRVDDVVCTAEEFLD